MFSAAASLVLLKFHGHGCSCGSIQLFIFDIIGTILKYCISFVFMLCGSICIMVKDGLNEGCVGDLPRRGCDDLRVVFGFDGEEFFFGFGGSLKGDFLSFLFRMDLIFNEDLGGVVHLSWFCFVSRSLNSVNGNWICIVVLC